MGLQGTTSRGDLTYEGAGNQKCFWHLYQTGSASWGAKVKAPLDYKGFAIDQEVSFEHFAEARKPKEGYPKNEHISAFDIDFGTDITAPETHGIKYVTNVSVNSCSSPT